MLSVKHFTLLIKHLDAVDQRVSMRLDRIRPWTEPHLTSLLCDLLDDETEHEETLVYSRKQLREDIAHSDEAMTIACRIDAIEYLPDQERHVTQGDLGLILAYRDRVSGGLWERGFLLQAKRATPTLRQRPGFGADSAFSVSRAQHARLQVLEQVLGDDVIRYLLYAPRPAMLRDWDRVRLAQARIAAIQSNIFDYTFGQALYEDAKAGCPTLSAGMLLTVLDTVPNDLTGAHSQLTQSVWPFSWFVAMEFGGNQVGSGSSGSRPRARGAWAPGHPRHAAPQLSPSGFPIVPFLRGDPHAIQSAIAQCGQVSETFRDSAFLPPHTMTIEITPGGALREEMQQ